MVSRHLIVKFYLWFLLALTLTVMGAAGAVVLVTGDRWERDLDRWVATRAEPVRDLVHGYLAAGFSAQELTDLVGRVTGDLAVTLAIVSRDGKILGISRPPGLPAGAAPLPSAQQVRTALRRGPQANRDWRRGLEVWLPIRLGDGSDALFFGVSHPGLDHSHPPYRLLGVLGAVLILAWVLCWPLAAYLARPLRRMASAADALGEGRLDTRIELNRKDEIGRLAERFNAMAANLERLLNSHKQLLADISHELRSPLARMRVALELARREAGGAAEPYFDQMERQSEALDDLIGQLLAHARLEANPHVLSPEPLDPAALAAEAIATFRQEARDGQVTLTLRDEAGAGNILADRQLLRRALVNGLSNGVAHAPPGSTVLVTLEMQGQNLAFRIADGGPGVAPAMLEPIFEPFFRADSARSRATGGVGLGLAIARRAMEAHGGGGRAESGEGQTGFVLTLWLPLRTPGESQ